MGRRALRWFLACLLGLGCRLALAQEAPTIDITWTNYLSEYDNYHPGPERVFRYTIRNTSVPSTTNNLFYFQLPVGLDAGLFYAEFDQAPLNWETWYGGASTLFANTNTPIIAGATVTLEVRTDSLATRSDYATALAVGQYGIHPYPGTNPYPAFVPVLVEVPAGPYPPPTLTGVSRSTNAVTLTAESLHFNYHYTLEQSTDLAQWTNAAEFWVTSANTNLTQTMTLPLAPNAAGQFFRLRSP